MDLGAKSGRVALVATLLEGGPDFGLRRTTPSLRPLGIDAIDVIGGVEAWVAARLPLTDTAADVRE